MIILEKMLQGYNDGRSKSFYCLAATLLTLKSLKEAIVKTEQAIEERSIGKDDIKGKVKILKEILNQIALEENEELKYRKSINR